MTMLETNHAPAIPIQDDLVNTAAPAESETSRAKVAEGRPAHLPPAVQIADLDLFYGKHQALHRINLEIPEKQVTAFIGPSGCGKSTLLRCVNRMNDLVDTCTITGSIKIHGREIYAPAPRRHRPAKTHRYGLPKTQSLPQINL